MILTSDRITDALDKVREEGAVAWATEDPDSVEQLLSDLLTDFEEMERLTGEHATLLRTVELHGDLRKEVEHAIKDKEGAVDTMRAFARSNKELRADNARMEKTLDDRVPGWRDLPEHAGRGGRP